MQASHSRHSPPQYMPRLLVLFTVSVIAFSILFSWHAWKDERAARIKELTTITELGEKSLDQYFLQMEASLKYMATQWTYESDQVNLQHAYQDAKLFASLHPEIINITMISSAGDVLFNSSRPPGTLKASIANDPDFIEYSRLSMQDSAMKIGKAKLGIVTKAWIVPIRYPIKDRSGKIQFTLSALLPIEFLQDFGATHRSPKAHLWA